MFYSFTLYSELEFLQARPLIFAFLRLVTHTPFPLRQKARTAFPRNIVQIHSEEYASLAMTLASIKVHTSVTFWPEFAHFLSLLNSHPSPNFRNIRAMPTDALTATVSPKATKRIKAIVSMFLSFKKLVERRESNPPETRLSRSLSTDALTGLVETARVSRRETVNKS